LEAIKENLEFGMRPPAHRGIRLRPGGNAEKDRRLENKKIRRLEGEGIEELRNFGIEAIKEKSECGMRSAEFNEGEKWGGASGFALRATTRQVAIG
jgi:hypothetical protein